MLLDHFKDEFGLDVEYEILETNGENRVGGRLFTHYFGKGEEAKPRPGNHNYYDVGGMRFPNSKVMEPSVDLLKAPSMQLIHVQYFRALQCTWYERVQAPANERLEATAW